MLGRFDLLLTDPPYGIGFTSQPTAGQRARGNTAENWDNEPVSFELLQAFINLAEKAIIWGGNYYPMPAARCWYSWYKPDAHALLVL